MELEKGSSYGPDSLERTSAFTLNPFWLDVISSLTSLQFNECFLENEFLPLSPLWYNSTNKPQTPNLHKQGIMVLGDVMDGNLPLEELNALYNVSMNFMDYFSLPLKINDHFEFLEKPMLRSCSIISTFWDTIHGRLVYIGYNEYVISMQHISFFLEILRIEIYLVTSS